MAKRKTNQIKEDLIQPEVQLDLTQSNDEQIELPPFGLGDTIAQLTKKMGIDECEGCSSRRATMNRLFPFLKIHRDLTEDDVELVNRLINSHIATSADITAIFNLYNDIFKPRNKAVRCNCPGTIRTMLQRIANFLPQK